MAVVSSCREMLGYVPQRAQPLLPVAIIQLGTLAKPPRITGRKVGMTSSPHGLYVQGYTRATMVGTNRRKPARGRKVGMTSSPHGLYDQGYTRATMVGTNRRKP